MYVISKYGTAFVIGASGYVGNHLCSVLEKGYSVFGTYFRSGEETFQGESVCMDIRDARQTDGLFKEIRPHIVFHLAGAEAFSRYDFAAKLAEHPGHDPKMIPKADSKSLGLVRPRDLTLDTTLARSLLDVRLRSSDELIYQPLK